LHNCLTWDGCKMLMGLEPKRTVSKLRRPLKIFLSKEIRFLKLKYNTSNWLNRLKIDAFNDVNWLN
jgi:hypothetical protein